MLCLFAFSYCSWGSQGKNSEVVCHSLLQWTMFSRDMSFSCSMWPGTLVVHLLSVCKEGVSRHASWGPGQRSCWSCLLELIDFGGCLGADGSPASLLLLAALGPIHCPGAARSGGLLHATTWMNHENTMLSERSQTQEATGVIVSSHLCEITIIGKFMEIEIRLLLVAS